MHTGVGVSGKPIGEGLHADDHERPVALLALEPRQRRVHATALIAAAAGSLGLHVAADSRDSAVAALAPVGFQSYLSAEFVRALKQQLIPDEFRCEGIESEAASPTWTPQIGRAHV